MKFLSIFLVVVFFVLFQKPVLCNQDYDDDEFDIEDDESPEHEEEQDTHKKGPNPKDDEDEDEDDEDEDEDEDKKKKKSKFDNLYDEDEFVGLEDESDVSSQKSSVESSAPAKPKVIELGQIAPLPWWQKWLIEIISTTFIVIYIINFYLGKEENYAIAAKWGSSFHELFRVQFSKVGEGSMLVKRTQNAYSMRATGRINCIGLQAVLKLKRRQDLPSRIYGLFVKSDDTLVIDIAMNSMEPMVFAVVPKKQVRTYRKNKDIEAFTNMKISYDIPDFPENFTILCDSEEGAEAILTSDIVHTIADNYKYIQAIHISDQWTTGQYNKVLRFIYTIPSVDKMEDLRILLQMSLHLIDHVTKIHLSSTVKKNF